MTNPMEYFAETTEALFSRNEFFPFTGEEIKAHDTERVAMLGDGKKHRFKPHFHAAGRGWVLVGDVGYDVAQIVAG